MNNNSCLQVSARGLAATALLFACLLSTTPAHSQLEVEKSFAAESVVEPGGVVIWQLHLRNNNPFTLTGVVVHEQVPLYTTFDPSQPGSQWVCDPGPEAGSHCQHFQDPVPPTETRNYRFVTFIDPALPSHVTQLENCFTVTYDTAQSVGAFEACAIAPIDPGPVDMVLEKSVDPASILEPGGAITWNLAYGNQGVSIAERVVVRETVPAHTTLSLAQSTPGWECPDGPGAGNLCVLRVGDFGRGDHSAASFVTVIDPDLPEGATTIENCASLTWQGGPTEGFGPVCAEATVQVSPPPPPSFTLSKQVDPQSTLVAGGRVIWLLAYTNTGSVALPTFQLHDLVPAHTTFDAVGSASFVCSPGPGAGSECVFHAGTLAPGQGGSARFITDIDAVLPPSLTQLENCFTATHGDTVRGSGLEACAVAPLTPRPPGPELTAWLDDELSGDTNGNGQANAGELVSYSTTITNTGRETALAVVFHLDVDPNSELQVGSVASSQGAVTLGNTDGDHSVQVELGHLTVNTSAVVTWTVAVRSPLPPEVHQLSVQGLLMGDNVANVLTDDPATPQALDPTVTPLFFDGSGVLGIPTLGELGLLMLVLLLGAAGIARIPKATGRAT